MYTIIPWSNQLNLNSFYDRAKKKGFNNNSSQQQMIDCFSNEKQWQAWILYRDKEPIGSVVAHTLDIFGEEKAFRILARCCVLEGNRKSRGLMTYKKAIQEHQNFTDQFFLPTCISWAGSDSTLYATSNNEESGSQKLVNRIYFPILHDMGIVEDCGEVNYRNTNQTLWKFNVENFYNNLNKHKKWHLNRK